MKWVVVLAMLGWPALGQESLLSQGRSALEKGDYPQAEAAFRAYLEQHPYSAEALSNLAAVYSRREQYAEAIALYQKALKANPGLAQIRFNLAVAQFKAGDYQAAAGNLRRFLKAYPEELRARQLLGLCLVESGEWRNALEVLESVERARPGDPTTLFALAYAHARAGDEARGQQLLAGLENFPAQARLIEGLILKRQGDYQQARVKLEECLRLDARQPAALAALGRLYLLENNDSEAIRYLEQALAISAQDAEATYQLGVLYARNQRREEGERMLRRAIAMRANYPDPYYQLARLAYQDGQHAAALKLLEPAVKLLPEHEAVRLLRARILQSLGRVEEAKEEFALVRKLKAEAVKKAEERLVAEIPLEP